MPVVVTVVGRIFVVVDDRREDVVHKIIHFKIGRGEALEQFQFEVAIGVDGEDP